MLLLIPGPVTTHASVRAAAAQDYAPWDNDFRNLVADVRRRVLAIAGGREGEHTALPLQGCGHFAMEAAVRTFVPPGGSVLVPMTGHYADRLVRLANEAGRVVVPLAVAPNQRVEPAAVHAALMADRGIGHVAIVYSETATGIVHDVPALAEAVGRAGRRVLVDAVSAFGALPFDIGRLPMVDSVAFTSNKCIEGLPGLSFTIARIDSLDAGSGRAGSWSLDLADVYYHGLHVGLGSHRFTPAAQAVAALDVALDRFDAEGGQPARLARYTAITQVLYDGVRGLGLQPCLPLAMQGPIVVNVLAPPDPAWDLQGFVDHLKVRGVLISNFYNTDQPSFRVGCIGAITPDDMRDAVHKMGDSLAAMGVQSRQAA
ncbi:MAG: 2-aminoethylphosphonate--pyruvate transaminase [Gemmatimonadaceae bacterium]|nr:2-aminoethylphosphonate--pyruvate transaminase [Acetobacteraceae bacterium]